MHLKLSNLRELNDEVLVKRAQDGDRKAFSELFGVTSRSYTGLATEFSVIERMPGTLARRPLSGLIESWILFEGVALSRPGCCALRLTSA